MSEARVAVIGSGSWGTALAIVLAQKGIHVVQWGRSADQVADVNQRHENRRYLPGIELPPNLTATTDLKAAVTECAAIVSVTPSQTVREVLGRAAADIKPGTLLVSASKGIETDTLQTMEEILAEILPHANRSFLSGPSFAKEVARGLPTAVVVAAHVREHADETMRLFMAPNFRVYTSDDVPGVEIGGALKNVMAIAAGIADGMELGSNTRAALITRGLAEISRLAVKRGAHPLTLAGLAGMGDLILTCTGDLSRNRQVGIGLGQGKSLKDVLGGMNQVAEGVKTTKSAYDLSKKLGVEMPITETIYRILYENLSAETGLNALMGRAPRHELT